MLNLIDSNTKNAAHPFMLTTFLHIPAIFKPIGC